MKKLTLAPIGIAFLLSTLVFTQALADVAPDTSTIGTPGVVQESAVRMVREKVTFKIPENIVNSQEAVSGQATFWLRNTTNEPQTLQVIFPIYFSEAVTGEEVQYASNVVVKVNRKVVPSEFKDGSYIAPDSEGELKQVATTGYVFDLFMKPRKSAKVVVDFNALVGQQVRSNSNLSIRYLLASGAGWKDSIKEAKIQVIYPFKLQEQWVSLEDQYGTKTIEKKVRFKTATWTFKDLEPLEGHAVYLNFVPPSVAKENPESNTVPHNPYEGEEP